MCFLNAFTRFQTPGIFHIDVFKKKSTKRNLAYEWSFRYTLFREQVDENLTSHTKFHTSSTVSHVGSPPLITVKTLHHRILPSFVPSFFKQGASWVRRTSSNICSDSATSAPSPDGFTHHSRRHQVGRWEDFLDMVGWQEMIGNVCLHDIFRAQNVFPFI